MRRILLIKPKRVGDMLLLTPTVSALKSAASDLRVEVLAHDRSAAILEYFPAIDRVWTVTGDRPAQRFSENSIDLIETRFDAVVELSGQAFAAEVLQDCAGDRKFRSVLFGDYGDRAFLAEGCSTLASQPEWIHEHAVRRDWLVVRHALGMPELPAPILRFPVTEVVSVLTPAVAERFAVFQPFSRDADRTWAPENWRALAIELLALRLFAGIVIPYGSDDERKKAHRIADGIAGCRLPDKRLDFGSHAALVSRAAMCVSCNTGVMHLAAAVQLPMVAVWGATPIKVWHPLCDRFAVVCRNQIVDAETARTGTSSIQEGGIETNEVRTVVAAIAQVIA